MVRTFHKKPGFVMIFGNLINSYISYCTLYLKLVSIVKKVYEKRYNEKPITFHVSDKHLTDTLVVLSIINNICNLYFNKSIKLLQIKFTEEKNFYYAVRDFPL